MKLETVKYGTTEHLEKLRKKIPYVDLDVVNRGLERCEHCRALPRWTAFNKSVGYCLECDCRTTTSMSSITQAVKSWKKSQGWAKESR